MIVSVVVTTTVTSLQYYNILVTLLTIFLGPEVTSVKNDFLKCHTSFILFLKTGL